MTDSENEHTRTIEIGGVKMEVDLRMAKVVEKYRVGDKIKVLVKEYSGYKSFPGTIVGFDLFEKLPTIVIAYIKDRFTENPLEFVYLNADSKEVEICPINEHDLIPTRGTILSSFERAIGVEQRKVDDLVMRRAYFMQQFGAAFGEYAEENAPKEEAATEA